MFFLLQNQRDSQVYDVCTKSKNNGQDYAVWGQVHCDFIYDAELNADFKGYPKEFQIDTIVVEHK